MKNIIRQGTKCYQVALPDIGLILLFEAVNEDGAIILPEENDRTRAAGLAFPGTRNALLDYSSAEIGINQTFVGEPGGIP